MLTPLSTVISTWKSARLVLSRHSVAAIDTTSPPISRSSLVRLSAPIHLTSCQVLEISTSHASPNSLVSTSHTSSNSLAFIFYKCFFYTLSDILAYVQDFLVGQDRIYVYEDVVKQVGYIFEIGSTSASGLVKTMKKDKSWALAS